MSSRRTDFLICLILAVVTLCLYSDVRHFAFVDYDDADYANAPQIRHGITPEAVRWALTSGDAANWFPLTRLSHMVDYQLYGPQSGPPHVTNVVLHVFACILLFLFLRRATGARWKSAFVAFVFAWHPLHVESVAWVAERKDVLCAIFWFLSLWLWVRYTERPGWGRYVAVLATFSLGLLSKPMIVTLPLVLLLLNRWPLRRALSRRTLLETVPFFLLGAADSVITFLVQQSAGAVSRLQTTSLLLRTENALTSYGIYFVKMFWPSSLAFFYPYPQKVAWWVAALCGGVLLAATLWSIQSLRHRVAEGEPLVVGWLWWLVTLLPVIGLVQVGSQGHADRYMYIPMTGLLIALAWGAETVVMRWPAVRPAVLVVAVTFCVALLPLTWFQIATWKDSRSLFTHGAEVVPGNYVAYLNLGSIAERSGDLDLAYHDYDLSRRSKPDYTDALYNLGTIEVKRGHSDEAAAWFRAALKLNPNLPKARNNMGMILGLQGRWEEASVQFEEAVLVDPNLAQAQRNLGAALIKTKRAAQAVGPLEAAVSLTPEDAIAHNLLGYALAQVPDQTSDAISHLREAVRLDPALGSAHENLGKMLARMPGQTSEAITELQTALRINPADQSTAEFLRQMQNARR